MKCSHKGNGTTYKATGTNYQVRLFLFQNVIGILQAGNDVAQMSVELISAIGSVAFEDEFENISPFAPVVVDLSELAPGSYTAVVSMDGVEYKQQIVKL